MCSSSNLVIVNVVRVWRVWFSFKLSKLCSIEGNALPLSKKPLLLKSPQCSFKMTWNLTKSTPSTSLFSPRTFCLLRLGCKSRWILLTRSRLDQASYVWRGKDKTCYLYPTNLQPLSVLPRTRPEEGESKREERPKYISIFINYNKVVRSQSAEIWPEWCLSKLKKYITEKQKRQLLTCICHLLTWFILTCKGK